MISIRRIYLLVIEFTEQRIHFLITGMSNWKSLELPTVDREWNRLSFHFTQTATVKLSFWKQQQQQMLWDLTEAKKLLSFYLILKRMCRSFVRSLSVKSKSQTLRLTDWTLRLFKWNSPWKTNPFEKSHLKVISLKPRIRCYAHTFSSHKSFFLISAISSERLEASRKEKVYPHIAPQTAYYVASLPITGCN